MTPNRPHRSPVAPSDRNRPGACGGRLGGHRGHAGVPPVPTGVEAGARRAERTAEAIVHGDAGSAGGRRGAPGCFVRPLPGAVLAIGGDQPADHGNDQDQDDGRFDHDSSSVDVHLCTVLVRRRPRGPCPPFRRRWARSSPPVEKQRRGADRASRPSGRLGRTVNCAGRGAGEPRAAAGRRRRHTRWGSVRPGRVGARTVGRRRHRPRLPVRPSSWALPRQSNVRGPGLSTGCGFGTGPGTGRTPCQSTTRDARSATSPQAPSAPPIPEPAGLACRTAGHHPRGRGATGRRAGFRSRCRKAWRFESSRPHSL